MAKVLVVDDEPEFRFLLHHLVAGQAHQVETADSAQAAIAVARTFAPDVLIIDRMLRDSVDGLDVARTLGAMLPNLATIVISGYPAPPPGLHLDDGICAFLEKPFGPEELLATLDRALAS